jgi:hypothetical protein
MVCLKTGGDGFLRFSLKTGGDGFSGLASKPVLTVSRDLASKPVVGFLVEPQNQGGAGFPGLGPQNRLLRFGDLGLKITTTVSWFEPQNHIDYGLSVTPQNRQEEDGVGHTLRSSILLRMDVSQARVFQSSLKTGGGAMTGGACDTITEVA